MDNIHFSVKLFLHLRYVLQQNKYSNRSCCMKNTPHAESFSALYVLFITKETWVYCVVIKEK